VKNEKRAFGTTRALGEMRVKRACGATGLRRASGAMSFERATGAMCFERATGAMPTDYPQMCRDGFRKISRHPGPASRTMIRSSPKGGGPEDGCTGSKSNKGK
jgi:hypothetical protein